MGNSKRKEIFILLLCLLLGFALRFYAFDKKSLWLDEVYTFNDSRYGLKEQIAFYKENPTFLHPPLFFLLTHLFYPFEKPERDLRIIPLIFGTLSIPMFYLLARQFSANIALPCTISLVFMTYHISLSQDGRSYSLLMFLGMIGLYFFMKYLHTLRKLYLPLVAFFYAIQFHTSYSSIPFIVFSQILWFYMPNEGSKKPILSSFSILNGLLLLFCLPWVLFLIFNYNWQPIMDPLHTEGTGSLLFILYGVFHDWAPHIPLTIVSVIMLLLFPFFSKYQKNAIVLLTALILPISGLYLFCKVFNVTHFVTSRYFINFLPIFLITLFLSISAFEIKFKKLQRYLRPKILFLILVLASNQIILPLYYHYEKQDFRGLINYLKGQLRDGDKIFVTSKGFIPGILHYYGIHPEERHYVIPFKIVAPNNTEYFISFIYLNKAITIYNSKECCMRYIADGNRLWIVAGKGTARKLKKESPAILKGYFDGSFLNFNRFPTDASMYLFLWDPASPNEKGADLLIE